MYLRLDEHIAQSVVESEAMLPLNPRLRNHIQAKLTMLRQPDLAARISADRLYVEQLMTTRDGRSLPIVALFPQDTMREGARAAVERVSDAVSALEQFLQLPYPYNHLRLWYGFTMGSRASLGSVELEERGATDDVLTPGQAFRLPHDAIVGHEVAHSFFSNEALTQFLELYVFNVLETGSSDPSVWIFTRAYTPFAPGNSNVYALLDVYGLIGHDAMSAAYRAARPLGARYGEALPPAVRAAFVDQAPGPLKTTVEQLVATVTF
jgi:hypothetical protein